MNPDAIDVTPASAAQTLLAYFTLEKLATVILLLLATWLVIRYLTKLLNVVGSKSAKILPLVRWTQPAMRIAIWFGSLLLAFRMLAPTEETFFAGLASGGLAIGLGAQDLVRNLMGGLLILGDRPFQLGDRVRVGEVYGEIDHVGLQTIKLTTPDDTRVTIPNAAVMASQVYNSNSGLRDCQVVTDLYLPPTTDPMAALKIGYEAAYTSPYLLSSKPVVALVQDVLQERPYLRLRVKAYVYGHRFEPRMQSDITARAKTEFLRRGLLDEWRHATPAEAENAA